MNDEGIETEAGGRVEGFPAVTRAEPIGTEEEEAEDEAVLDDVDDTLVDEFMDAYIFVAEELPVIKWPVEDLPPAVTFERPEPMEEKSEVLLPPVMTATSVSI